MLPKKPMLKENYQSVMMSVESMQLRNQENTMLLKGKTVEQLLPSLLPLLDGLHTVDDIAKKLDECPRKIIEDTIQVLCDHFVIEDGNAIEKTKIPKEELEKYSNMVDFLSLFSEHLLPSGEKASKYDLFRSLQEKTCLVYGLCRVGSQLVLELAKSGIKNLVLCDDSLIDGTDKIPVFSGQEGISKAEAMKNYLVKSKYNIDVKVVPEQLGHLENIDILIYSEDIPTSEELRKINKYCIDNNISWINLKIGELKFQVGPLVVPNETACYECATNRINGNLNYYEEEKAYENYKNLEKENVKVFMNDMFINIAVNITVWEVVKYLTKIYSAVSTGRIIFFDGLSMELSTSNILKMPKCPACSKREKQPFIEPYAVYLP